MDVHCTTCGEPWDTHHLWQDAIHETSLTEHEIKRWRALPTEEKLSKRYRQEFKDAGYVFGQSVINVTRCPGCPPDAKADPEALFIKAELETILAGDEDGLAAHFGELGL